MKTKNTFGKQVWDAFILLAVICIVMWIAGMVAKGVIYTQRVSQSTAPASLTAEEEKNSFMAGCTTDQNYNEAFGEDNIKKYCDCIWNKIESKYGPGNMSENLSKLIKDAAPTAEYQAICNDCVAEVF